MNITKWMFYIKDIGYHKIFKKKIKKELCKATFIKF